MSEVNGDQRQDAGGWTALPHSIIDQHGAKIGPYGLAALCALLRHANPAGVCWPGIDTIAALAGMSRGKVFEKLKQLKQLGIIKIDHKEAASGRTRPNEYTICALAGRVSNTDPTRGRGPHGGRGGSIMRTGRVSNTDGEGPYCGPEQELREQELREQEPEKKKRAPADGFSEFWSMYPRKAKKTETRKAWDTLNPDQQLQVQMLAALDVQKQSPGWNREGGRYIPYPDKWIHERRWEDEHQEERHDGHQHSGRSERIEVRTVK